jgi:hypothetical protein
MRSPRIFILIALAVAEALLSNAVFAQQPAASALLDPRTAAAAPAMATLKVCLRLEDETPFTGFASVRIIPDVGNELLGMPAEKDGEFLFSGVTSGKYTIEVAAPGFQGLSLTTQIDDGPRLKTLFVPMRQRMAAAQPTRENAAPKETAKGVPREEAKSQTKGDSEAGPRAEHVEQPADVPWPKAFPGGLPLMATFSTPRAATSASAAPLGPRSAPKVNGEPDYWSPHELEQTPPVDPNVTCPCEEVLRGVGRRMSEFVDSLEKFTATEKLEHFYVDRSGALKSPESRSFAYVAAVSQNSRGTFLLEEFRNGTNDAEQFPAHTATRGSPAMALIFHPALADGFDFRCEGLGQRDGREAWMVHFVQRPDRPIQIRSYSVAGKSFPLALEGRVWVDPGNNQVIRLESELVNPITEIGLTHEHFMIDYKPVQFRSTGQQLWLPQMAELYVERKGKRFYRRHSFSDFRLFNVDAAQSIQTPSESFSFTNTTDHDVQGELTVARRAGMDGDPVTLNFVVPAHGKVFKLVGPGKDVDLPVLAVGAATFVFDGDASAVKVDTHLLKETSLDVVPSARPHSP